MKFRKIALTFILVLVTIISFGCSEQTESQNVFNDLEEQFAFEVTTVGNLIDNLNAPDQATPVARREITEELIDEIHSYLEVFDSLLANDNKPVITDDEESDLEEYEFKKTITTTDINNHQQTFIIYYNETAVKEDLDDNDELKKVEISLEGILVMGDNTYEVIGEQEIKEDEMEFEFEAKIDQHNYVWIEQETEATESDFKYTICVDGIKETFRVKLENEDNETHFKIKTKSETDSYEYSFKKETIDNYELIKIKIKSEAISLNIHLKAHTDPETNEVTYEYKYVETDQSFYRHKRKQEKKENKKLNTSTI